MQLSRRSSTNQNEIGCAPPAARLLRVVVVVLVVQMAWVAERALYGHAPLPCEAQRLFSAWA